MRAWCSDLFERCRENGYIYKGSYTGQYCIFDNLYVNDAKPGDPCPDCGRPTETVTEENFFFKLSAFQDRLLELYESQPDFIQPETRRNEVISFVRQGLDRSFDHAHQYQVGHSGGRRSAARVLCLVRRADRLHERGRRATDLWPADLHLIGKEIVRFHAVYWPAFLMAAGSAAAEDAFSRTAGCCSKNDKMSKSRGNIVRAEPIRR